jgi:hypothetical protein
MAVSTSDDLARTRVLFEQWRATRQGRSKIPDELWQAVLALHGRYSASQLCHELHLSAGALRARLREQEKESLPIPPTFVPLPRADCGGLAPSEPITTREARIRLVWERADGSRLLLSLPASQWTQAEALCTAFFRS